MFRFHKVAFLRLYRYYCKKVFWTWLLYFALTLFLFFGISKIHLQFQIEKGKNIWNEIWKFSLLKLSVLVYVSSSLISSLVWEAVTKKEDAAILIYASPINRQSMLAAKTASFFTYYLGSNFLLSAVLLLSAENSLHATLIFLLFDGLLLAFANFLLFYTPLFYFSFPSRNKEIKFLIFFIYFVFLFSFILTAFLLWDFLKTPWIPLLLSFPVGVWFLLLYWNDFRQHDYT